MADLYGESRTLRYKGDSSACMKAPNEEIYSKSTQGTLLKSTFSGL